MEQQGGPADRQRGLYRALPNQDSYWLSWLSHVLPAYEEEGKRNPEAAHKMEAEFRESLIFQILQLFEAIRINTFDEPNVLMGR